MNDDEKVIVCDNCHCNVVPVIKHVNVSIKDKRIEVGYFNCQHCKKAYITEVIDYTTQKKMKKVFKATLRIQKKKIRGILPKEEEIRKAIELKDDLISYEMKLKDKYKELIPRKILV